MEREKRDRRGGNRAERHRRWRWRREIQEVEQRDNVGGDETEGRRRWRLYRGTQKMQRVQRDAKEVGEER